MTPAFRTYPGIARGSGDAAQRRTRPQVQEVRA